MNKNVIQNQIRSLQINIQSATITTVNINRSLIHTGEHIWCRCLCCMSSGSQMYDGRGLNRKHNPLWASTLLLSHSAAYVYIFGFVTTIDNCCSFRFCNGINWGGFCFKKKISATAVVLKTFKATALIYYIWLSRNWYFTCCY